MHENIGREIPWIRAAHSIMAGTTGSEASRQGFSLHDGGAEGKKHMDVIGVHGGSKTRSGSVQVRRRPLGSMEYHGLYSPLDGNRRIYAAMRPVRRPGRKRSWRTVRNVCRKGAASRDGNCEGVGLGIRFMSSFIFTALCMNRRNTSRLGWIYRTYTPMLH